MIGKKFKRLTPLEIAYRNKSGNIVFKCQCDCENIVYVSGSNLNSKNTKSCGCISKDSPNGLIHGMKNIRFYRIWANMKDRCLRLKNKAYPNYGGRGIKVCDRWLKFENFRDDMYEEYLEHSKLFTEKNTTIDRINNNGNYCLDNCRWATRKEQTNNRNPQYNQRTFKAISPNSIEFTSNTQLGFAKEHELDYAGIWRCLNKKQIRHKGWKFEYLSEVE